MPEFGQLVSVLGGPAAVALIIWLNERKNKDTPKDDAGAKLVSELSALNSSINSLRSELAELGGFIKGRMK